MKVVTIVFTISLSTLFQSSLGCTLPTGRSALPIARFADKSLLGQMQVLIKFQVIETSIRAKRIINFKVVVLQDVLDNTSPAVLLRDEGGYSFFFTGRAFCGGRGIAEGPRDNNHRKTSALGD
jgi:hypothetical protein